MISPQGTLVNNDIMAQIIAKLSFLKEDKFLSLGNHFVLGHIMECFTLSQSCNKIIPKSVTDMSPHTIKRFEKPGSFQNS